MSRSRDHLQRTINNLHRRLQHLQERKALQGLETPSSVIIEIEDLEAELAGLQAELAEINQFLLILA